MRVRTAQTFWEGFEVQRRVVGALLMREMITRFGKRNLGFMWLFFEPLLLGGMVALIHVGTLNTHGPVPVFLFYIIGYLPFFVFRAVVNRAPAALHSNLTLLFHRMVTLLDVMIARNILEFAAVGTVTGIVLLVSGFFFDEWTQKPMTLVFGFLLMFMLANGIALAVASAAAVSEAVDRLLHPITYLMMPLSGCFFTVDSLPPSLREPMLWVPLVQIHEMIRDGQFGDKIVSYYDYPYTIMCCLFVNLLGLAALRSVRPKLEVF